MPSNNASTKNWFIKNNKLFLKKSSKKIKVKMGKQQVYDDSLVFKGYPGNYKKGKVLKIKTIKDKKNLFIIHAGTKLNNGNIYSNGGRVLNIVGKGQDYNNIRKKIIKLIKKINWRNGFFRKDIGWRVINKLWEL